MVLHDDPDGTGRSRIDPYIAGLVADCEDEVLTAQPQTGRDAETLAAAAVRDTAMLERGTRMRTLYQHSARRSAITNDYVAAVTERGAEVRTLDEFFNRMIVFDHRIAVIPGKQEDLDTAVVIREPSVVDYLVDVFERAWERGRPFTSRDSGMLRDIAAEQRAMTIRMLIEGHADPVSAKRLGVSPRTYAGYVADLKQEYEAETRFQLGYTMGTQGVSGPRARRSRTTPTDRVRTTSGHEHEGSDDGHCPRVVETGAGGRRWDPDSLGGLRSLVSHRGCGSCEPGCGHGMATPLPQLVSAAAGPAMLPRRPTDRTAATSAVATFLAIFISSLHCV